MDNMEGRIHGRLECTNGQGVYPAVPGSAIWEYWKTKGYWSDEAELESRKDADIPPVGAFFHKIYNGNW